MLDTHLMIPANYVATFNTIIAIQSILTRFIRMMTKWAFMVKKHRTPPESKKSKISKKD